MKVSLWNLEAHARKVAMNLLLVLQFKIAVIFFISVGAKGSQKGVLTEHSPCFSWQKCIGLVSHIGEMIVLSQSAVTESHSLGGDPSIGMWVGNRARSDAISCLPTEELTPSNTVLF